MRCGASEKPELMEIIMPLKCPAEGEGAASLSKARSGNRNGLLGLRVDGNGHEAGRACPGRHGSPSTNFWLMDTPRPHKRRA